jgi:hypothetical protein
LALCAHQAADAAQRGGASLKSLTLARDVRAKSATHAVCCETLKCAHVVAFAFRAAARRKPALR